MSIEPARSLRAQTVAEAAARQRIARAVRRARLALLWEAAWPRLVPPLMVAGLFLAVSWFGVWIGMPDALRVGLLAAFAVAGLVALLPLLRLRLPSEAAALARVERVTARPHRPASAVLDRLGAQQEDPATQAIWAAHRTRLLAEFGELKAGLPAPGVARRDPYALRFLVLLLLAVAALASQSGLADRVADAFRGPPAVLPPAAVAARIDAWAAPPAYTGRPPIFLTGSAVRADTGPIAVPVGTEIIVRIAGAPGALTVGHAAEGGPLQPVAALAAGGDGPAEHRIPLAAPGTVTVREGGAEIAAWAFTVIPDHPPTVAFSGQPTQTNANGVRLEYTAADDYGVTALRAEMALADPGEDAVPVVAPPELPLTVPGTAAATAAMVAVTDLTAHPWAGLRVGLTLIAADAIGQEGRSVVQSFVLPSRPFINPLARALVEQRQILALDARERYRVAAALDLLTVAPELFTVRVGDYLAVRSAYYRLAYARDDDALRGVVDYLWELALAIEGDPVADAASRLEAVAEAIREALARNAEENELQALLNELRAAIADYLAALEAQEQAGAPQNAGEEMPPADIGRIIEEMEELAAAGDQRGIEERLADLERMLQNLQAGNIGQMQPPNAGEEAFQDLFDIIRNQQQLRDETFGLQQDQNRPVPTPRTNEEARQLLDQLRQRRADQAATAEALAGRQGELGEDLDTLMAEMDTLGFLQEGNTLGPAREDMTRAGEALARGDAAAAAEYQARALDNLQGGAQDLAGQLARRAGEQNLRRSQAGGAGQTDPLGRPMPTEGADYGDETDVPEEIDRQRAREILETIRRRLEEQGRPVLERDYLERLLELF